MANLVEEPTGYYAMIKAIAHCSDCNERLELSLLECVFTGVASIQLEVVPCPTCLRNAEDDAKQAGKSSVYRSHTSEDAR